MDEKKKKDLEKRIVDIMITALENSSITPEESSLIAAYVLNRINLLDDEEDLSHFLKELIHKWQIFSPILVLKDAEMQDKVEDEIASGVLTLAQHGKIDEAVKLAKTGTSMSGSVT